MALSTKLLPTPIMSFENVCIRLLQEFHSSPIGGHAGIARTFHRLSSIQAFVTACQEIVMDLITSLPSSMGKATIMTVVDRLSKYGHFIPWPSTFTAHSVAFVDNEINRLQGTYLAMSTAYHPQTDGNAANDLVEKYMLKKDDVLWVGVTCDYRHQRVKSLNLSRMALTDRTPRDFGNLTFLVSLDLRRNNFHGNLPQEMVRLRRLKFLKLSFNNLRGEIPSWFGFLHQLQVLNLGNNSFTGSIPPSLSNASRLETLEISANLLEGNIPEEIGNLQNLKFLSIQYNKLTGSIPFTIFNISSIQVIAFTNNSLSGNLPNGLCNGLPTLKKLYLSTNKLHGHMPTSLSNCSQLQILSLSGNNFDGPIHSEIGR
ncbi:LRR receptor-like serine/threonine-protein kinase GSO2, partial [Solanum tuberosum]|uniref:LRR receptor-like serine/threonine-protein kinase GSO2 n=1 Tax=Solanum tuberosum TaxID=4113 RepID=UPI00073A2B91